MLWMVAQRSDHVYDLNQDRTSQPEAKAVCKTANSLEEKDLEKKGNKKS